jgi:hypothetical protein
MAMAHRTGAGAPRGLVSDKTGPSELPLVGTQPVSGLPGVRRLSYIELFIFDGESVHAPGVFHCPDQHLDERLWVV